MMEYQKFNTVVVSTIICGVILCVAFNYKMDIYGLYGNRRGKSCVVLGTERSAKYLFSYKYIPSNFDGILIGSSISDNWDTSILPDHNIYNISIAGGNISEEAIIAENVFKRASLKTVIFVIYPYLTETHGPKTGFMTQREYWASLGSIQLLSNYSRLWKINNGYTKVTTNNYGAVDFEMPMMKEIQGQIQNLKNFRVNEKSFAEYENLLKSARRNGGRIVGVVPLVSPEVKGAFDHYNNRMKALFNINEDIIDLNECQELDLLKNDRESFPDGVHYSNKMARKIMESFALRIIK